MPNSSTAAAAHQNSRRRPSAPPRLDRYSAIGRHITNSMPRSLGSLKMPTYWMRVPCDSSTPVQPMPVLACSMPCTASTEAQITNTPIAACRRARVSTALASST